MVATRKVPPSASQNFMAPKARAMFLNKPVPGIIAGMFVLYGEQYAQILEQFGEACGMGADEVANETAEVRKAIAEVRETTLTAGWDDAWFRRAYDANGNPVGTNEDSEGKIYIEPQGMCVMAGIGVDDGKAAKALESTKGATHLPLGHRDPRARILHLPHRVGRGLLIPTRL